MIGANRNINLNIVFPVIGFQRDGNVIVFASISDLSIMTYWDMVGESYLGMELIDCRGNVSRILSLEKIGTSGPIWLKFLSLFLKTGLFEVAFELEKLDGEVSFSELQEKICLAISEHPEHFFDEEIAAGEGRLPPQDWPRQLAFLTEKIRRAKNIMEIRDALEYPYAGILPGV